MYMHLLLAFNLHCADFVNICHTLKFIDAHAAFSVYASSLLLCHQSP